MSDIIEVFFKIKIDLIKGKTYRHLCRHRSKFKVHKFNLNTNNKSLF